MPKQPNIIFILTDDQGAWAMNCAGNSDIITPNLNKLSQDGVRYDNFFCASPVCSPARASIVTGRMPSAHGIHDWLKKGSIDTAAFPEMAGHEHFIKPDKSIEYLEGQKTYIEHLAENGYNCALSGKWHLGNNADKKKGFDKWFALPTGGGSYFHHEIFENGKFFSNEGNYLTDTLTDKAIEFIEEYSAQDKPYYVSLHFTAPHTPWGEEHHPKKYLDLYKNCKFTTVPNLPLHKNQNLSAPAPHSDEDRLANLRGYFAAITALDANIGKVIDKLKKLGTYEDTVIIFSGDNGMNMGHHGVWGKGNGTYPPNMYDEAVKIPFIIKAPFIAQTNRVEHALQSHIDVFGTILEIANIDYTPEKYQAGVSFYKNLTGEANKNNEKIFICDEYAIVQMIRTIEYKYIKNHETGEEIFYDLINDKNETKNAICDPRYENKINEMRKTMNSFFDNYRIDKFDGRHLKMSGRGQLDLCYNENAFELNPGYYYTEEQRKNM